MKQDFTIMKNTGVFFGLVEEVAEEFSYILDELEMDAARGGVGPQHIRRSERFSVFS